MGKAYVIFTEDIKDPEAMKAYGAAAVKTMPEGVKFLAADPKPETLEGEWHGTQTVLLEFKSVDAAKAWYNSDEYQAAAKLRHAAADSNGVILTGF